MDTGRHGGRKKHLHRLPSSQKSETDQEEVEGKNDETDKRAETEKVTLRIRINCFKNEDGRIGLGQDQGSHL